MAAKDPFRTLITRSIKPDLWRDFSDVDLEDLSLIAYEAVSIQKDITSFAFICFSSPRSVQFFINQVGRSALTDKQIICLGKGTATALDDYSLTPYYVGDGVASSLGQWILQNEIKNILFPISEQSRRSIQSALNTASYDEVICYQASAKTIKPKYPAYDIIIATSPMQAERAYRYSTMNTVFIAIGAVTAARLSALGSEVIIVPLHRSESSLAMTLKEWLKTR